MNLLNRIIKPSFKRVSYSQQGEDLIVDFLLSQMGIKKPYYVDIGANDPIRFSNTFLFYKFGATGVCVEPNPFFSSKYRKLRPKDLFINAGISGNYSGSASFYHMNWHEFSTFDKDQALAVEKAYNGRNNIKQIVDLPIISVSDLLNRVQKPIDFLNLDVEGLDFEILNHWDFSKNCPKVICVECKLFKDSSSPQANIQQFLEQKGYVLAAHNPVNGIFTHEF